MLVMADSKNHMKNSDKRKNLSRLSNFLVESPLESAKLLLEKMSEITINHEHQGLKCMTALQIILKNIDSRFKSTNTEREIVNLLLQKGANVYDCYCDSVEAPIHFVNSQNFDKSIRFLFIDHLTYDNINQQDELGETVLHYAVGLQDEEYTQRILQKGANIMIKSNIVERKNEKSHGSEVADLSSIIRKTPLLTSMEESNQASM